MSLLKRVLVLCILSKFYQMYIRPFRTDLKDDLHCILCGHLAKDASNENNNTNFCKCTSAKNCSECKVIE